MFCLQGLVLGQLPRLAVGQYVAPVGVGVEVIHSCGYSVAVEHPAADAHRGLGEGEFWLMVPSNASQWERNLL